VTRPDPFTLVFGDLAEETFSAIREELDRRAVNPADGDAFVLAGAVGATLRMLVPEDAPPEALERHVALLHHAYRYWNAGCPLHRVEDAALRAATIGPTAGDGGPRNAYVQLPERRVWGDVEADAPPQPMDGFFLARHEEEMAELLGIFGLHAARSAFAVVPVAGPWDEATLAAAAVRPDGSELFSSQLSGGDAAGLLTVATGVEVLLLARRLAAGLADPPAPG
jgi:hypothetical protein